MIAFDAKRAFFNRTGLGNFSRSLINALAHHRPDEGLLLYTPSHATKETYRLNPSGQKRLQRLALKPFGNVMRVRGLGRLLSNRKLNVYHGLSNELPFDLKPGKPPAIVTIHDLLFLRYPKSYPFFDRQMYAAKWKHACRVADCIVAVSEQTRRDIVDFLKVPVSKTCVIYQSCEPIYYQLYKPDALTPDLFEEKTNPSNPPVFINSPEVAKAYYKLPKEYILYVGSVTERKNLLTLVKAIEILRNRVEVVLVVVGTGKTYLKKVRQYIHEKNLGNLIHFLGRIPTAHLPHIYGGASLMVHPSVFEGFGIPIIEALQCGVPVVASQGSCFAEAGGEGTIYVPPYDAEAFADVIERVLTNSQLQSQMIVAGLEHVQQFEPQKIAAQYWRLYDEVGR